MKKEEKIMVIVTKECEACKNSPNGICLGHGTVSCRILWYNLPVSLTR